MMRDVDGRLLWLEAEVELDAGAQGVVIVVTSELAETHLLPFPVAEAVTVGATPATRFLVQGLRRSPATGCSSYPIARPASSRRSATTSSKWSPMASRCRPTSSGGTAGPSPVASPGRRDVTTRNSGATSTGPSIRH